jgi:Bacterial Ig-like domain
LRKIAAVLVAIPFLAFVSVSGLVKRQSSGRALGLGSIKLLAVVAAVVLLVAGLLVGLPAKQVVGQAPPTFAPLAPQANVQTLSSNSPLDAPLVVQFTKPMNEATVEGALTITPAIGVEYRWDGTAQLLSIVPLPHWQPSVHYSLDIGGAASDQEGLGLANASHTDFDSGALTSGTIAATEVSGGLVAPTSSFQITFTRPVKLAMVLLRFGIVPQVPVTIAGDDPTDAASQVFTMTPKSQLASNTVYTIGFSAGGTDSSGTPLKPVAPFQVSTMVTPSVVRFRPQDGTATYDTNQTVSVRFTMAMDEKSTAAALSVTVSGRAITGSISWSEGDTVLALTPRSSFKVGNTVVARVSTAAKSQTGLHLSAPASATFTVSKPRSTTISFGGVATSSSPWYPSEVYYFNLMNCTRTGNWVTSSGACSTETHHTLPAQGRLSLSADISNRVSRPYAAYMAKYKLLDHYLNGTSPHSRLCAAGYCGASWGENIASPGSYGSGGMISVEIFYQNEYWCRCEHYYNIMDPYFHRAGVGVWYSNSVRVAIDFYG